MKKNILIISQYFWPEDFKINDLAEELVKREYSVNVLTGIPNYPQGKYYKNYSFLSPLKEEYKGIKIKRVPLIPRGKSSRFRLVLNYLSFVVSSCIFMLFHHKKYDAVLVFATSPITVAFPAIVHRWFHKTKTLLWVLDLWPESVSAAGNIRSGKIHNILERMVKFIYKHVDKILISSRSFRKSIEEKGVPADKIFYIPNWAENYYEKPKVDREKYKTLFPEGFKVMFTGNIGEAQDCEALLEAAKYLSHRESRIQLLMVGDGRKRVWFEEEVSKHNLNNVCFLGRFNPDEMPDIIAHADALLVSLKDEPIFALTVPTRIQTSLVSGKPIVTMLNGEGSTIINEAGAGLTAKAGDFKVFAENIYTLSMLSDKELKEMGHSGKIYYDACFNRTKIITEIERLLVN
jgi:glycosyltransferase involved in cell wall biosynthesis